jgi:riboflavin kinase/FMN adenylyltransferase
MNVLERLDHGPSFCRPVVVAIGNFDGLHLGHQKILRFLVRRAKENHLSSLVLTFSPHPEKVLGQSRIAMIQTLPQRLAGIEEFGVRAVLVTAFDRTFSSLSSREFVREVIVSALQAREVIVGENFRFGRNRQGDTKTLEHLGSRFGFAVHPVRAVVRNGRVVSSSLIRSLLVQGKIVKANSLLGRAYEIEGQIIKGAARGKTLGFPTTNIRTANEIAPQGVFVTEAQIHGRVYPSVTNIGTRPTFGEDKLQVESFLFGFRENAYRRKIKLRFLRKLRDERKFSNSPALVKQIRKDIARAQNFFASRDKRTHTGLRNNTQR